MVKGTGLTDALARFARITKRAGAPRPGSNYLPLLEIESDDGTTTVLGEELDALHRAGLLTAAPDPDVVVLDGGQEWGEVELDHLWTITDAGRSALAELGGAE
nr:hypothetical protein NG677_04540 [Methylobacterium sp. OTU13CASTA1]